MSKLGSKINFKTIITLVLVVVLGVMLVITARSFKTVKKKQNFEMPNQVLMIEDSTEAETEK